MNDIRDAFRAVGTTQPVRDGSAEGRPAERHHSWADETDSSSDDLPEGIYERRNALHDDLRPRRIGERDSLRLQNP